MEKLSLKVQKTYSQAAKQKIALELCKTGYYHESRQESCLIYPKPISRWGHLIPARKWPI